jgi:hypothetical protein
MRVYQHITRECTYDQLKPEMRDAFQVFEQRHLPLLAGWNQQVLACVETTSTQVKISFMDRLSGLSEKVYYTGALVTSEFVVWATCGPRRKATVLATRLVDIELTRLDYAGVRDTGLDLFGLMIGGKERIATYIALGADPAAQKFELTFRSVLEKAYLAGSQAST